MHRIKTLHHEAVTTDGCDWIVGPAETVVLTGHVAGTGVMTPHDGRHPVRLEMEIETFGWDRDTGEPNTVTWVFEAEHRIEAISMLISMAERVRAADVALELELVG
jgi:hypothetical protein